MHAGTHPRPRVRSCHRPAAHKESLTVRHHWHVDRPQVSLSLTGCRGPQQAAFRRQTTQGRRARRSSRSAQCVHVVEALTLSISLASPKRLLDWLHRLAADDPGGQCLGSRRPTGRQPTADNHTGRRLQHAPAPPGEPFQASMAQVSRLTVEARRGRTQ